jgi:DNA polymerase III subunit delta'
MKSLAMTALFSLTPPVVGHVAVQQQLCLAAAQGRLPHALLLQGPRGIGKATLARQLTAALVSGALAPAALLRIDPEHPHVRLLQQGAHPDVLWLERPWDDKQDKRKTDIPVELVRDAIGFARRTAALSPWRVIGVDAVDDLNPSAANALLKILEEPPAGVLLILISHAAARVLPTLRSRCRVVPLLPLDAADFAALAAQLYPDAVRGMVSTAWRESGGRMGAATALLSGTATARPWQTLLHRLASATPQDIQQAAENLGGSTPAVQEQQALAASATMHLLLTRIREQALAGAEREQMEALLTLHDTCQERLRQMQQLNLDPKQVFLQIFGLLQGSAANLAVPGR